MSKPAAKRKRASRADVDYADDSDASVASSAAAALPTPLRDLSSSKTSRKNVAAALLSLLPDGATKQSAAAKKLASAFPLVIAELDARSKALARANESEGTRLPIAFRFESDVSSNNDGDGKGALETVIHIPEECFVNMLKFLNGREVVNSSLVNKVWLSASRMPALWEQLDASCGLTNSSKKMNMTGFIKLLGRPQFQSLKLLALPYKIKLGKSSLKQIAKACPHLETLDMGYSCHITGPKATDEDLIQATEHFPNLSSVRTDMWNITNYGIASVARAMGDQLLDLRIRGDTITHHYLSDATLDVVVASCQNLEYFAYRLGGFYYDENRDLLSGVGITALVRGCRGLKTLELDHARRVSKAGFETILQMIAASGDGSNNERGFALRKIHLVGYPFVIKDDPFRIEDTNA